MKTTVLALIGVFCFINFGYCEGDVKSFYKDLKPLVDQSFKDANDLLEEVNKLKASSKESVQDVVNLARGAALEAQLLISSALKEIKSGKDENALVHLKQIPSQLSLAATYTKDARDQIKSKLTPKK